MELDGQMEVNAPQRLSNLRRVATIESVGSSTRIQVKAFATRDEQEVVGYAQVMETVFAHADAISLTENHLKQLHRDLLQHSAKDNRHRGEYKTLANHVQAFGPDGNNLGVVFETATPFDTPRLMTELVEWTQDALHEKKLHPLLCIAVFIVVFWPSIFFKTAMAVFHAS
jgi:hypothetical protein